MTGTTVRIYNVRTYMHTVLQRMYTYVYVQFILVHVLSELFGDAGRRNAAAADACASDFGATASTANDYELERKRNDAPRPGGQRI